jgi:Ring finger domain
MRQAVRAMNWRLQQLEQERMQPWDPNRLPHDVPTSLAFLDTIPRIVLNPTSHIFREASLGVMIGHHEAFPCILGEFGPTGEHHLEGASLVLCVPRLDCRPDCTHISERLVHTSNQTVAFMLSGGILSFVQKAMIAQLAGASAVIFGNTELFTPWPRVIRISEGEAEEGGLTIPIATIKEAHAQLLLNQFREQEHLPCSLHITALDTWCAICHELFAISETVMEIPGCEHVFHEQCAMEWLQSRHTCPMCSRQLPTRP